MEITNLRVNFRVATIFNKVLRETSSKTFKSTNYTDEELKMNRVQSNRK